MRIPLAFALVSTGCFTAPLAHASNPARHSVAWYDKNVAQQSELLKTCVAQRQFLVDGDCDNANMALLQHLYAETTAAEQQGQWGQSLDILNANPADYRTDKFGLTVELGACHGPHTSATPRASWCAAADEAKREDGR